MRPRKQQAKAKKWVLVKLICLILVSFGQTSDSIRDYMFRGISTLYPSYHASFEQDQVVKANSIIGCVSQVGLLQDGSQEDWRISFRYNRDTNDCQIGKVPFQLVNFVEDKAALDDFAGFEDDSGPVKLYLRAKQKDFTKIAVIGGNFQSIVSEVIDLSPSPKTCSNLPLPPITWSRAGTVMKYNDQLVLCATLDTSDKGRDLCHILKKDLSGWDQLTPKMTIGRVFAHAVQRDFNDFWLMGGVSALHTPYIPTSDSFKNGQINPTGQINNLPTQLRHMDWGICHVQVDLRMQFYAGGSIRDNPVDLAGLWNADTNVWIDLPKLDQARDFITCGFFRNSNGGIEIVAAGGRISPQVGSTLVEIYNPSTLTKRLATPLTFNAWTDAFAQFSDHFVRVGGWDGYTHSDKIYKFDPMSETFVQLAQTIQRRDWASAIAIPDSMTNCN